MHFFLNWNYPFCRKWILKAEDKKSFQAWTKNIRKVFRPKWVDKSVTSCWVQVSLNFLKLNLDLSKRI
jgi:hypothetical protein